MENKESKILSELVIKVNDKTNKGELHETVVFGPEVVDYKINGIVEHVVFGIYFSFNQRFEY
jgi:hypothetical protein